jgi:hypothetical protein
MYPAIYFLIEAAVVYGITAMVMYLSWRLGGDSVLLASSVATYLMLLTTSQFLASKIMNIGYANLPAGTMTYSATVATLDVITLSMVGDWVTGLLGLQPSSNSAYGPWSN